MTTEEEDICLQFGSLSLDKKKAAIIETTKVLCCSEDDDPTIDSTCDTSEHTLVKSVPPFYAAFHDYKPGVHLAFESAEHFAQYHLAGAEIEKENDIRIVEEFNKKNKIWKAWILCPSISAAPLDNYQREWILVVQGPLSAAEKFPGLDERCGIHFTCPFQSKTGTTMDLKKIRADRMDNPFETVGLKSPKAKLAAFRFLPKWNAGLGSDEEVFRKYTLTTGITRNELAGVSLSNDKAVLVQFTLFFNEITFKTEKNAISAFLNLEAKMKESIRTAPPHTKTYTRKLGEIPPNGSYFEIDSRQAAAFKYILDPRVEPDGWINIFHALPHMSDPMRNPKLPQSLQDQWRELNDDHKRAYKNMRNMPCGLHFVSGCPGAGKTHWNVLTATIAMAGSNKDGTRPKILYIIDMNKPVDDVANRIVKLCRDAKISVRMVRMRGWNREISGSTLINNDWRKETGFEQESSAELAKRFLNMAQTKTTADGTIKVEKCIPKNMSSVAVPSLDQACWDHFVSNISEYEQLAKNLASCLRYGAGDDTTKRFIKTQIKNLYLDTLRTVDFVATTPVAAANPEFISMFDPDLVFMDEAPHARELTSLVPLAMYRPKAWIFTGDYRQTQPYVANLALTERSARGILKKFVDNPFACQLQCSTMERVEMLGGHVNCLMINHRALGNLQRLASKMFYNKRMVSANSKVISSPSAQWLHSYIVKIAGKSDLVEPRIFVHIKNAHHQTNGVSTFNSHHEDYAIARIKEVLTNPSFKNTKDTSTPGRILVIAPYRAAIKNYSTKVSALPHNQQQRIDIRTIDTAQGHEADLVILDLVRTERPGFLNDRHRLNVALTRARQGEIVLMHPGMIEMMGRVRDDRTIKQAEVLTGLWKDAKENGLIVQV